VVELSLLNFLRGILVYRGGWTLAENLKFECVEFSNPIVVQRTRKLTLKAPPKISMVAVRADAPHVVSRLLRLLPIGK